MKPSLLFLFLIGAAFVALPCGPALADDSTTTGGSAASGTDGASNGKRAQKIERIREAFAQLDLADAQKAQIKQIRAGVTDRRKRRQQIMAILTPEQKTKLKELHQEHKNGAQTGEETPSAN